MINTTTRPRGTEPPYYPRKKGVKTSYLQLSFDTPLQSFEIPKFRAAVIEKTKRQSDLFHNHTEDAGVIYRYPLIQYKIKDKKPCIICLREATDDIHFLLKERNYRMRIGSQFIDFEIEEARLKYEYLDIGDQWQYYNVHNWMPLNQDHYAMYMKIQGMHERVSFLENLLRKQIAVFAESMDINSDREVEVEILEVTHEKYIEYKNNFHLTFCINIRTNVTLPEYIGLGKGVSVGFGIVKTLDKKLNSYE
ncbi:MAG TPA: CRISPR-associated endonuclease Cas6 [Saprospiraceae bacterium]|nr:CRISPR-associated endonuclease Cas6 [Saprospiraceae bacterium]